MATHINVIDSSKSQSKGAINLVQANSTAVNYSNQAVAASQAGDYARAVHLHRQALVIKLQAFGEEAVQTAISFNGLGEDLLQLGQLDEAEEMLGKALHVRDDTAFGGLGAGPRMDAAVTRENVAQLREAQGRLADAKEMRLRGKGKGEICCGHYACPGQMFKSTELKSCANCSSVFYCSATCQKADWRRHKKACKSYTK